MVSWFPASNEPLSDFSMNALRRIFSLLSPVLALALVVGLFCALLAWKDVRDFQQQHEGVAFT